MGETWWKKITGKNAWLPYLTILGAILLLGLMITTWFTDFKIMLQFGIPWLAFLSIAYFISKKRKANHHFVEDMVNSNLKEELEELR